jgi:hypothetical protein
MLPETLVTDPTAINGEPESGIFSQGTAPALTGGGDDGSMG